MRIEGAPLQFAKEYKEVRLAKTERFPYVVYYQITKRFIQVFAILHERRDPEAWKSRL